jgi:hypothetical protein
LRERGGGEGGRGPRTGEPGTWRRGAHELALAPGGLRVSATAVRSGGSSVQGEGRHELYPWVAGESANGSRRGHLVDSPARLADGDGEHDAAAPEVGGWPAGARTCPSWPVRRERLPRPPPRLRPCLLSMAMAGPMQAGVVTAHGRKGVRQSITGKETSGGS